MIWTLKIKEAYLKSLSNFKDEEQNIQQFGLYLRIDIKFELVLRFFFKKLISYQITWMFMIKKKKV
jgi:hypothetical protein